MAGRSNAAREGAQPDGYLRGRIEHDSRERYYAAVKGTWVQTDADTVTQTDDSDLHASKDGRIVGEIMHHIDGASEGNLHAPGMADRRPHLRD